MPLENLAVFAAVYAAAVASPGPALAALIVVVLSFSLSAYAPMASRARLLFRSMRAVRALSRGTGTVMAGAAVAVAVVAR